MRVRRSALAANAALASLGVTILGAAPAATAALRTHSPVAADASAAAPRFWTPTRMRSARPLDTEVAGSGPATDPLAVASFAPVPDPTAPPNAVNGRVFVRLGDSIAYCSGTAIDSASRRLVLTAGHCVNSGPRGRHRRAVWYRSVEFVPAYAGGVAPFGEFAAERGAVYALTPWIRSKNVAYDLGAFLTRPNAEGRSLADVVGGVRIASGLSRRQEFQTFGYPGTGSRMQTCSSPYIGDDLLTYRLPGPPTIGIRCHWTPGASGGGWLIGEGAAIDGVTSYGRRRDPTHTFSPYFAPGTVGKLVAGL